MRVSRTTGALGQPARVRAGAREGEGGGAHGDREEEVSLLGEALVVANRRRQWSAPKIEDHDAGDEPALPGSRSSAER